MIRVHHKSLLLLPVGALLALTTTATAQDIPGKGVYIGAFGGGVVPTRAWDLGEDAVEDVREPGSGFILGGRIGVHVNPDFTAEASVNVNRLSLDQGGKANTLHYSISAIHHFQKNSRWSPFLVGGLGLYQSRGKLGSDVDPTGHAGVGLRFMVANRIAVRVDLRDVISDGFDTLGAHNFTLTAGIDVYALAKPATPPVKDTDRDGVADDVDACPDQAGGAETRGCPDRDGDKVADGDDKCPDTPGLETLSGCPDKDGDGVADDQDKCPDQKGSPGGNGCPDQDGDGITDANDKCPDVKGLEALGGCPDKDGDGVADTEDKCPDVKGTPALGGCPDKDGDGVTDAEDKCPDQPGKPALGGCPDGDNDGVADADDKCPTVTGLPDHNGCLPAAVKKFTGAIRGINFQSGKDTITPGSFGVLGRAVKLLKEYPTLRIRIDGHTDSRGAEEANMTLSKARAEAVKTYLVGKGIDVGRIETQGFGETKPIGDNKSFAGRRENRRIEFTVLGQ